ncbi:integrator complex subunit 7-like [Dreissena polymorpha]|uniref:integrator complex subunit 7-like n=1 Tax=Dreissena polymorpha TaxID=45954 RepID=UPI002263EC5D|nr:integrator complex subunit 7-like [Dreissena polymorpha]
MAAPVSTFHKSHTKSFKHDVSPFDQEQDANSALSDLDRGLRSMKVGVQCEAVVRFPGLFEKYPFPILINSAFLRLADVFRAGNNFIRWCILRVTHESEKHLDKILNVDEFMRRIFSVYHSNDPVARAVTLRVLANISLIISERKNIHHSITVSLDSHDAVEVQAAIYAAQKFSEQSRVFAANICDKISEMIHSVATPVDLKLSLIPVLQFMHHDVSMATKARNVCLKLLDSYPAEKFKVQTLSVMSHLASLSLIDIPAQIDLLLEHVCTDPRSHVGIVCLQELHTLALKTPHLWTYNHIMRLCEYFLKRDSHSSKLLSMNILAQLSKSVTFNLIFTKSDFHDVFLSVCNHCYASPSYALAARVIEFYTHIVIAYCKSKTLEYWSGQNLVEGAVTAIQTQILIMASEASDTKNLKLCLKCAVDMVKSHPKTADSFATCIADLLPDVQEPVNSILSESLAAIGSLHQTMMPQSVVPQILPLLEGPSHRHTHQMQVYLCTVLFQVAEGKPLPVHIEDTITACFFEADPWLGYKLSRAGMRYGQSGVAHKILSSLALEVASEHFHFWLNGLRDICKAESELQKPGTPIGVIQEALAWYHRGLTSLKAAVVLSFPLQFQCEYIQLRASLLESHTQLLRTCNTFKTCPPPAIATHKAQAKGLEITKYEHIVSQLGKTGAEYSRLSEMLATLYQQSFDADPDSLIHLQLLQTSCELMKLAITSIAQTGNDGQTLPADKMVLGLGEVTGDKYKQLLNTINAELTSLINTEGTQVITYKHMSFLTSSAHKLATSPCCFPRYFFQSLQQTALKLAISPQQTGTEPVLVQNDTYLALTVEGIIQHGARPGRFRKVKAISVSVVSNIISRTLTNSDQKLTESTGNTLEQAVEPHNDYFTLSFILRFPVLGLHAVTIQAAILDTAGAKWHTGPRVGLQVKSYDDAIQKQQQVKHAQRPTYSQLLNS